MSLKEFKVRGGERVAVDMSRVEAITEDSGNTGCVTLVTHSDTYRVVCKFEHAVNLWKECEDERK